MGSAQSPNVVPSNVTSVESSVQAESSFMCICRAPAPVWFQSKSSEGNPA
jgi:hypothetical protein